MSDFDLLPRSHTHAIPPSLYTSVATPYLSRPRNKILFTTRPSDDHSFLLLHVGLINTFRGPSSRIALYSCIIGYSIRDESGAGFVSELLPRIISITAEITEALTFVAQS